MTNEEIQAQLMRQVSPSATLEPPQFADQVADRVVARLTTGGEYLTRVIRELDDARRLIGSEQSARAQAEADRREAQSATDRRIEDLRVSLIRAINTALSRAGVELPTSAAATVETAFVPTTFVPPGIPEPLPSVAASTASEAYHVAHISRLERHVQELRDCLEAMAHPEHGWPLIEIAHRFEESRRTVPEDLPESFRLDRHTAFDATAAKLRLEIHCLTTERDELRRGSLNSAAELNAARAAVKALEDWRADVTVALQRPGGAHFADVPKHVCDLVNERNDLKRELELEVLHGRQTARTISAAFTREKERADAAEQALADATEWRPMREHIAAPTIVAWRGEGGRVGVYGACNFGPLPKHQQSGALGWLPIPPYRAKEGQ